MCLAKRTWARMQLPVTQPVNLTGYTYRGSHHNLTYSAIPQGSVRTVWLASAGMRMILTQQRTMLQLPLRLLPWKQLPQLSHGIWSVRPQPETRHSSTSSTTLKSQGSTNSQQSTGNCLHGVVDGVVLMDQRIVIPLASLFLMLSMPPTRESAPCVPEPWTRSIGPTSQLILPELVTSVQISTRQPNPTQCSLQITSHFQTTHFKQSTASMQTATTLLSTARPV